MLPLSDKSFCCWSFSSRSRHILCALHLSWWFTISNRKLEFPSTKDVLISGISPLHFRQWVQNMMLLISSYWSQLNCSSQFGRNLPVFLEEVVGGVGLFDLCEMLIWKEVDGRESLWLILLYSNCVWRNKSLSSFSCAPVLVMLKLVLVKGCWLWEYLKACWCCKVVSCDCAECIECDVFVEGTFWLWLCDGSRTFTFVIQQPKPCVYGGKNNKKEEEGFVRNCSTNIKVFLWKTFFFSTRLNLFRFFLFFMKAVAIATREVNISNPSKSFRIYFWLQFNI